MKRKQEIAPETRKVRKNVSLSQKLVDDTENINRSEALEEAYWAMKADIDKGESDGKATD